MTKYKVLKEFICDDGILREVGEEYPSKQISIPHFNGYIKYGFIEEIEEPNRWRAPFNGTYYAVGVKHDCREMIDNHDPYDDEVYQSRNYFRSKKTTELVTEAQKLFFEWLHTPLEITSEIGSEHWMDMHNAMNEARAAVFKDNESAS